MSEAATEFLAGTLSLAIFLGACRLGFWLFGVKDEEGPPA